jgi:hypothetical protein
VVPFLFPDIEWDFRLKVGQACRTLLALPATCSYLSWRTMMYIRACMAYETSASSRARPTCPSPAECHLHLSQWAQVGDRVDTDRVSV